MGLMLDTGVFIWAERRGDPTPFEQFGRAEEMVMSAITASELLIGVFRADSDQRKERRLRQVDGFITSMPVLPFTVDTARVHARLHFELQNRGLMIGANDLIIAATALEHGHRLLTTNRREFDRVQGLDVIAFSAP